MRDLFLIRHGQTDWNLERRIQGLEDTPLNARGRSQVQTTAQFLAQNLAHHNPQLWTSALRRAHQSASIIAEHLDHQEVRVHDALHEFDLGAWSGHLREEIRTTDPIWPTYIDDPHDVVFPQGESMAAIRERAKRALADILERSTGRHIIIVSHGGLLRVLIRQVMSWPSSMHHQLALDNASITRIQLGVHARPKLICLNHAPEFKPLTTG